VTAATDRLAVARDRFADAVDRLDAQAATETIGQALADGLDPVDLIEDVIAPSQRLVGERWERGDWSVAQQHAATGLATAAVCALDVAMPPAEHGLVVLACAEREWHALPLQLIGATLRAGGWQVSLLGSAVTASRLSRTLHELGPDAVAVSSSVLGSIPNARRCVEASTTVGIPIVVGGPAFGTSGRRAEAIGATAWAPTARELPAILAGLPEVVRPVPPLPRAVVTELATLDAQQASLVKRLVARWRLTVGVRPDATQPDTVADLAVDVVRQYLHAVHAAVLLGDSSVISDIRRWALAVFTGREVPDAAAAMVELDELVRQALAEYPLSSRALSAVG